MVRGVHGNVRFVGFGDKIVRLVQGLGRRGSLESRGKAVWSLESGVWRRAKAGAGGWRQKSRLETGGWRQKNSLESVVWRRAKGEADVVEVAVEVG